MAGGSSEATLDINIDTKRSSTAVVREALFRATGEKKWTVDDEWAYFLVRKALRFIFHAITTSPHHRLPISAKPNLADGNGPLRHGSRPVK
jgi:hypothetical protein